MHVDREETLHCPWLRCVRMVVRRAAVSTEGRPGRMPDGKHASNWDWNRLHN